MVVHGSLADHGYDDDEGAGAAEEFTSNNDGRKINGQK